MDNVKDCIMATPIPPWSRRDQERAYDAKTKATESALKKLQAEKHTSPDVQKDILANIPSREARAKQALPAARKAVEDLRATLRADAAQTEELNSLRRSFRGMITSAGGIDSIVNAHDDAEAAKAIFQLAHRLSTLSQYQKLLKEMQCAGALASQGITAPPRELAQETINEFQAKLSQSQNLVQDLQVKLSQSQDLVQDLEVKLSTSQDLVQDLQSDNVHKATEIASMRRDLHEAEQKANKAKRKAKNEKTEKLIFKQEVMTALKTISATQQKFESLQERFTDLQDEHAGCGAQYQLHHETDSQLQRTNSGLEQALADSERKRKRMDDDNERNQRTLVAFLTRSVRIEPEDSELAGFVEAIQAGDTFSATEITTIKGWSFTEPWGPGVAPLPPGDGQRAIFTQVSMELYLCMRHGRWDSVATRLAHDFCDIVKREPTMNFGFVDLVMSETISAGEVKPRADWTAAAYSCWLAIAHAAYILYNRCQDAGVVGRLKRYLDKFGTFVNSSWVRAVLLGADESEAEPNRESSLEIRDQDTKIIREETAEKPFVLVTDLIRRTVKVTSSECWALGSVDNAINVSHRPGEVAVMSFDIDSQEDYLWYLDNILG